jgi:hypothetical protein
MADLNYEDVLVALTEVRQETIKATLAAQDGRCAACEETPALPHCVRRDGERERVVCQECYILIEDACERYGTRERAAEWLRTIARYLATAQGGDA